MAPKRKLESSGTPAAKAKRVTGLDLFQQKFINDNKEKYGSDFVRVGHRAMLDAWTDLPSDAKEEYKARAKRTREADMASRGIPPKSASVRRGPTMS